MKKNKSILFILPSFSGILILYLIPFGVVLYYSLIGNLVRREFVFLDNYQQLFKNEVFMLAARNTLKFSMTAVPLLVVLSLTFAAMLDEKMACYALYRTLFLSPIMVPVASVVLVWQALFHLNGLLGRMFETDWLKSEYGWIVVLILFIWKNLGYNMILFTAALTSVPKDLIEVAILENAKPYQIFWKIKIRYVFSTIVFTTIMSLINSFKIFREAYLLTGDYPYESVYFLQTFMNNIFKTLDYQRLSAAAIIMCLVMIVIISILMAIEKKMGEELHI